MATYNFAKKKKQNLDDTHTEMRLKEQHDNDAPEVLTDKQLKKDSKPETEVTTEKQLEKKRTGGSDVIIEKNLDDSKGLFGSKPRNSAAYEGDINKLEEKRLSGHKTEDEKYSASSETPKKVRWWDNLKQASSDTQLKTAQLQELDLNPENAFQRLKGMPGLNPDEEGLISDMDVPTDIDEEADNLGEEATERTERKNAPKAMFVTKDKEGSKPFPHIYMELNFDPNAFGGDENAMKEAALDKVLELRPNLDGKIDVDDFADVKKNTLDSSVTLRLIGDEYFGDATSDSVYLNVENEEVDLGGTPMMVGKVQLGDEAEAMETEDLIKGLVDYVGDQTGLDVPEASIQINLENNEATFAFESHGSDFPEEMLESDDEVIGGFEDDDDDEEYSVSDVIDNPMDSSLAKTEYDFPIVVADSKKN